MNECANCAEATKVTLEEPSADEKREGRAPSVAANAVTVSATSTTVITSASSATTNDSLPPAEALWNQFLKNISQQSYSARCKYPNPEVPEFYPRSANVSRVAQSTSNSGVSKSDSAGAKNLRFFNKSELIKRVTTNVSDLGVFRGADKADGALTRYYWSFHDVSSEYIPRCLNFNVDLNGAQLKYTSPAIEYGDSSRVKSSTSAPAAKPTVELGAELATKNQQLAHLNNVVKALLEEIWKINELSTRQKNREQWKNDLSFAINEFLKPTTELGFHCDDCCDRLKEFVTRASKQLEHRIAKQHNQYKNNFVESILSVVENSLRTLTCATNEDFKCRLLKRDVYTQTEELGASVNAPRQPRMEAPRRSKLQITKVYRNRNFYKCYDDHEVPKNQWYTAPASRGEQSGGRSTRFAPPTKSYSFQSAQHGDAQNPINPIQLIHQKYKNLNCRLEGIPDKNMVKFSYIVNGREYSAVASTKKEAQYHCAWHVLGASSQE